MLSRSRGYSLIELMIAVAILGILVGLGIPAFNVMLKNLQIRSAAESLVAGLQSARNEAVRRNSAVRFQLVDSLGNQCALLETGPNWVISRNIPTAKCDQAEVADFLEPNVTAQPQILQKKPLREGTAQMAATAAGAAANTVIFNSLGRVAAGGIDTIDVTNSAGGTCTAAGGPLRCLRILVGAGGKVKVCDPAVAVSTPPDSRYCQ